MMVIMRKKVRKIKFLLYFNTVAFDQLKTIF